MAVLKVHGRVVGLFALIVFAILSYAFFSINTASPSPQRPPLLGTFLYFHDVEFKTPNRKLLGAVNHADIRYARSHDTAQGLGVQETRDTLRWVLESYVTKMRELDAETWMAHGTLLGWWWNKRLLPWDTDLDVHMPYSVLSRLAQKHNGTTFELTVGNDGSEVPFKRRYFLDINPHFRLITKEDDANHIDARWIDTSNGKYLDITAVHNPLERDDNDHRVQIEDRLWSKDCHSYASTSVYPLQPSTLEGIPVRVPRDPRIILVEEYTERSLRNTNFHWHHFNRKTQIWEAD